MNLTIFLGIYLFQILLTLNHFSETCQTKSVYTWTVYFLHHLLDVYLFWSFLFLTTKADFGLHLIVLIGIVLHWLTYDNKCIATVIMNRQCGYSDDTWLDSIKTRIGMRNVFDNFHFPWMFALAIQDIYKVFFN